MELLSFLGQKVYTSFTPKIYVILKIRVLKFQYPNFIKSIIGGIALKKPGLATKTEGNIIGLRIADDLALHRGTGAIIWKEAGWQKAGLTNVDWGKAFIDKYHFKSSFTEAAENAAGIRFEVSNLILYITSQE